MRNFVCFLLLLPLFVCAQEVDTLSVDSITLVEDSIIVEPPAYYGAAFALIDGRIGPTVGGTKLHAGLGFGVQYNKWSLGYHFYKFGRALQVLGVNVYDTEGQIEALVVFPNVFELEYAFGGPFIGFELYDSESWSLDLYGSYQFGDMIWEDQETQVDFLRDEFSLITFGGIVDFDNFRYAKPYVMVGYQTVNNLDLTLVENSDFSGIFLSFGVRVGFYNQ